MLNTGFNVRVENWVNDPVFRASQFHLEIWVNLETTARLMFLSQFVPTNFSQCTAQKRSVRTLFATAQQPHSRDINQNNLPLEKLINQQEGILIYKVINGSYLLNDFLNHGDVSHQIQLRNVGDLRVPLYAATQSQLFVCYRANNVTCYI